MFPVDAFRRTMIKFVDIVQTLDIPFHITGGAVSSAYGEPRLTQDIDIVISPSRTQAVVEDLITRLKLADFLFTESVQSASDGHTAFLPEPGFPMPLLPLLCGNSIIRYSRKSGARVRLRSTANCRPKSLEKSKQAIPSDENSRVSS